ncbi:MAG: phosphoserine transaminase [Proteobacteria bacterium]|nr:phosphoserine transaminase [Pseudomonadota bacterium]MDA0959480.1 phosphoserine transaminase [Pseudomonadota bacterium]
MTTYAKPVIRPVMPYFSSGPTKKHPGWSPASLNDACTSRSHRSKPAISKIKEAMKLAREVLGLPDDYRIGIVPGSDTGAVEMAMWSLLGARGVEVLAWEAFGKDWVTDAVSQLKIDPVVRVAPYGQLPDLSAVDFNNDVIFTWNGTAAGVKVPNGDWIPDDRAGLTIADSTSACFAMDLPWHKLDVVTFSFQKSLGGEGGHGVLILSPRAVERLETYTPSWPVPKLFRLTSKGKLNEGIFGASTINTPSMLVIEDAVDALGWAKSIGGLPALIARSQASLAAVKAWVQTTPYFGFLAEDPATISNTGITLSIIDPWFVSLDDAEKKAVAARLDQRLQDEGVAMDAASYRDAPPGLRIWAGPTVEPSDIEALLPWLDWAYAEIRQVASAAA